MGYDMKKQLCAFIPNKIGNKLVVDAFDVMSKQSKLFQKDYSSHLVTNEERFKLHLESIEKAGGYIEDQSNYGDMPFGESNVNHSGCEIISTYNALFHLTGKHEVSLPQLIAEFEKKGMVLSGKFGTSPKAVMDYLKSLGFECEMVTKEEEFNALGKRSATLILTMYNDGSDITQEVHTIHVSKDENQYTAHNTYGSGKVVGPAPTVTELISMIHKGKAKGISLIGINRRK